MVFQFQIFTDAMLGKILGGRYQIVRHLGGGGFGQTYLAEDLHLPGQPTCVVKQLKPRMTNPEALQTARRLFDTEAQVLYSLGNHDQIPRLFAHFAEDRDFYLVQEFIPGEVLSQELKVRKRMPENEVIHLIQEILSVLEFVHQQQVVHRDIKPSNLMRRQSDRRIILIDFGAVKQIGIDACDTPDLASVTIAVGSSGYMPNEQLAGKPRFASDIYAVGMLAIQCLTGIYPKKLKEDPKTSEIIWRDQVQVNPDFADILDGMVRYDFRQRYPSAGEALEALKELNRTSSVATLLSEQTLVSFDGHLAWLERGDELFHLQRYKDAIAAYDRVIQAKPNDYLAWFKRGIALENLKHYDEAAASYEQVVLLHPDDYLAWYKRGSALELLHRYQESLPCYERVVQLQPDNYWAWHDRGKVLEAMQQYDLAIASYDRAVQLKPDFQLAIDSRKRVLSRLSRVDTLYHLQHYDEAVASCDRAIRETPNDPIPWLMRGMAMENLNCPEQAIAAYDRVVEIQPDDHVAWFKRATVLEKLQRYEEAVASYYRVVQIQPDNYWAWNDRGRLLEKLQRYEEAIASYDRTVQLKPDFQAAVEGRRRMLGQLQQGMMAPPELPEDETVTVDSTDSTGIADQPTSNLPEQTTASFQPPNLQALLVSYKQRLQEQSTVAGESTSADETFVRQHPIDNYPVKPNNPEQTAPCNQDETTISLLEPCRDLPPLETGNLSSVAQPSTQVPLTDDQWVQKGHAMQAQRCYEEALHAYEQAAQLRPDRADLCYWQGNVLVALGQHERAIAAYQQTLELQPQHTAACCRLGGAYAHQKQHDKALQCFEQALQLNPTSHLAWYWKGRVLCELKRYPEAGLAMQQAIALKPNFQPAMQDWQRLQVRLQRLTDDKLVV